MSVVFTSLIMRGDKNVKPDEHGYYPMVLGKFNAFNKSGIFYRFTEETKKLVTGSSALMRRVQEGKLKGELGHPKKNDMSMEQYLQRLTVINEDNTAIQIREFTLHDPDQNGEILVTGWVRPAGAHIEAMKKDFEDPFTNTALSLRSIVKQRMRNGTITREIINLVTWDVVGNNGVEGADKVGSLTQGLESYDDYSIEESDIPDLLVGLDEKIDKVGLESDEGKSLDAIKCALASCQDGSCYLKEW